MNSLFLYILLASQPIFGHSKLNKINTKGNDSCVCKYFGDSLEDLGIKLDSLFEESSQELKLTNCPECILLQYHVDGYSEYTVWYFFVKSGDNGTLYFSLEDDARYSLIKKLNVPFDSLKTMINTYGTADERYDPTGYYDGYYYCYYSKDYSCSEPLDYGKMQLYFRETLNMKY